MSWLEALPALHFVRPQWLWALLLLPVAAWWWRRRRARASAWQGVVDAHLLPALLERTPHRRGIAALATGLVALALAVVALAGPAWRKVEHPLWQTRAPLVVALDLSSAMLANDLPPNRLAQARAKLASLLGERSGGQVGLVAYAGDAFTVAPLTADAGNVAVFLDALAPDVMPVDGQRTDRAIRRAAELLRRAGFRQGGILVVTDHADAAARAAAEAARRDGYSVSALGIGTAAGAPYRDAQGRIGQARLDAASLRALAAAGGGRHVPLAPGLSDLRALGVLDPQRTDGDATRGTAGASWRDEGYWLLPALALLALFAFRRGAGMATALLLCAVLPARAAAVEGTPWRRADQVAHARMERGADAYRRGDFEQAARAYAGLAGADAHYNRGNALAKLGRYDAAIAAYDRALALQPGMPDAIANRQAVENARKRRQPADGERNQGQQQSGGESQSARGSIDGQPERPSGQQQGQGNARQDAQQRGAPPPSGASSRPETPPPVPGQSDAQAQQRADAAQRERMQRALARQQGEQGEAARQPGEQPSPRTETAEERERRLANEAWLRRVPDDPGGLLRAKFRLEYERRQRQGGE